LIVKSSRAPAQGMWQTAQHAQQEPGGVQAHTPQAVQQKQQRNRYTCTDTAHQIRNTHRQQNVQPKVQDGYSKPWCASQEKAARSAAARRDVLNPECPLPPCLPAIIKDMVPQPCWISPSSHKLRCQICKPREARQQKALHAATQAPRSAITGTAGPGHIHAHHTSTLACCSSGCASAMLPSIQYGDHCAPKAQATAQAVCHHLHLPSLLLRKAQCKHTHTYTHTHGSARFWQLRRHKHTLPAHTSKGQGTSTLLSSSTLLGHTFNAAAAAIKLRAAAATVAAREA
jgi:hypothetical protein